MTVPAFETEVSQVPDIPDACTIRVRGKATYDDAPELRESILGEISRASAVKVVLELSGIEEIDTAGAAVLVEALRLAHKRGQRLLLCSPSESVLRMFRLAGFEDVLDYCCSTPEEALQRLIE